MKKKINLLFLFIFNFAIIYFLKDFVFNNSIDTIEEKVKVAVIVLCGIALNALVILFSKKELSPSTKFAIIATFIGVGYIFISPLLRGIDETAHFSRVYSFFMDSKTTDSGDYVIPEEILKTNKIPEHNGNFSYLKTKIIDDNLVEANKYRGARLYTPISYLPYLIPVWVLGFLVKSNLFLIVTSARFFGFLTYLLLSIYAIKTIPKRKDFLALFCLMPILLSSGATVTADLLTNSSIIVFIAIWYKLYYEKKQISVKDIVLIIITGILAGYAKMVDALEFLLVLFLPKECFGGTNKKKAKILCIICGIVLVATLINVFNITGSMNDSYENMKLQKEFVLSHPIQYLKIFVKNILDDWTYVFSFTTNYTILQNIYLPTELLQMGYFIALLMGIYMEEASLDLGKVKPILIFLIGALIIFIITTSLYLQWTADTIGIGTPTIGGLQPRYWIPVMLMFLVCLPSKKDTLNIDKNIPYYISLLINITILFRVMILVI